MADDELVALRRWKAEAMVVLTEWDRLWEDCGSPGPLGGSKAVNTRRFVNDLIARADAPPAT